MTPARRPRNTRIDWRGTSCKNVRLTPYLDEGVEEATPSGPERACDSHNARGSRMMNLFLLLVVASSASAGAAEPPRRLSPPAASLEAETCSGPLSGAGR